MSEREHMQAGAADANAPTEDGSSQDVGAMDDFLAPEELDDHADTTDQTGIEAAAANNFDEIGAGEPGTRNPADSPEQALHATSAAVEGIEGAANDLDETELEVVEQMVDKASSARTREDLDAALADDLTSLLEADDAFEPIDEEHNDAHPLTDDGHGEFDTEGAAVPHTDGSGSETSDLDREALQTDDAVLPPDDFEPPEHAVDNESAPPGHTDDTQDVQGVENTDDFATRRSVDDAHDPLSEEASSNERAHNGEPAEAQDAKSSTQESTTDAPGPSPAPGSDETPASPPSSGTSPAPTASGTRNPRMMVRPLTRAAVSVATFLSIPMRLVPESLQPCVDWLALTLVFWTPIVWLIAWLYVG